MSSSNRGILGKAANMCRGLAGAALGSCTRHRKGPNNGPNNGSTRKARSGSPARSLAPSSYRVHSVPTPNNKKFSAASFEVAVDKMIAAARQHKYKFVLNNDMKINGLTSDDIKNITTSAHIKMIRCAPDEDCAR